MQPKPVARTGCPKKNVSAQREDPEPMNSSRHLKTEEDDEDSEPVVRRNRPKKRKIPAQETEPAPARKTGRRRLRRRSEIVIPNKDREPQPHEDREPPRGLSRFEKEIMDFNRKGTTEMTELPDKRTRKPPKP